MYLQTVFGESSGGLAAGSTTGKLLTNTTLVVAVFSDSTSYNNNNNYNYDYYYYNN